MTSLKPGTPRDVFHPPHSGLVLRKTAAALRAGRGGGRQLVQAVDPGDLFYQVDLALEVPAERGDCPRTGRLPQSRRRTPGVPGCSRSPMRVLLAKMARRARGAGSPPRRSRSRLPRRRYPRRPAPPQTSTSIRQARSRAGMHRFGSSPFSNRVEDSLRSPRAPDVRMMRRHRESWRPPAGCRWCHR